MIFSDQFLGFGHSMAIVFGGEDCHVWLIDVGKSLFGMGW